MASYNTSDLVSLLYHFTQTELRNICDEVGVDFDDLFYEGFVGYSFGKAAEELVLYCEGAGKTALLISVCRKLRPDLAWSLLDSDDGGTKRNKLSRGDVLMLASHFVSSLTLGVLALAYGPFNDQTPRVVIFFVALLSLVCISFFLIHHVFPDENGCFLVGFLVLMFFTAGIFRRAEFVEEILGNAEGNVVNFLLAFGLLSGSLSAGELMSGVGDWASSGIWQTFQSYRKKRRYSSATVLFLVAAIAFVLFLVLGLIAGW